MAIGHLTPAALKAMREHGHPSYWEVATYCGDTDPDSVTVECTKCGEVLVELINPGQEEGEEDKKKKEDLLRRVEARFSPEDLDDHVHELKSAEAATLNNAGIEEQFEYLYASGGAVWVETLLEEVEQP